MANPAQGLWRDGEKWTLEEELRIGSFGGDPGYQFGQVGQIAEDSQGRIYVSDTQAREVRVYSATGEYLQTVAGPGSGPGELGRGAQFVLLTPGDTLLVPDLNNQRINRYEPDGTPLPSRPVTPADGRLLRFQSTGSGRSAVQIRPMQLANAPQVDSMDAVVEVLPSGLFGDTLLQLPTGGLFRGPGLHYFTPEPIWDVTDSLSVVYGMNNDLRIRIHDRTGTLRRIVTKPYEPVPLSERDLRALFAYLDRAWLANGVRPGRLPARRQSVSFEEHLPAFFTVRMGPGGSLWVQRVQRPGDRSEEELELYNFVEEFGSVDWDVFDADGRYLGVVTMPEGFQLRTFTGDRAYGVARDEVDVPYVVRLRVVRAAQPR